VAGALGCGEIASVMDLKRFGTTLTRMTFELQQVSLLRGEHVALRDIDLRLSRDRLVGVIGPNGSGKSSLLAVLAGDLRSDQGRVCIDDEPVLGRSSDELAKQRAIMAQQSEAIFNLTVRQVLELGLFAYAHWPMPKRDRLLRAVSESLGLDHWLDESLTARSLGQQQRVHFARALLQAQAAWHERGCAWLLLDEPTASQDPWHQQSMLAACKAFLSWGQVGVVVVMHDLTLAAQWCDDLVVLKDGDVLTQGPCRSVLTDKQLGLAFGNDLKIDVRWAPLPGVIMSR